MKAATVALALLAVAGCEAIDDFGTFHVVAGGDSGGAGMDLAATAPDLTAATDDASPPDASLPDAAQPADLAPALDFSTPPDLAPPVFPSCVGLAKTCGPNGSGDCCESPLVPGGMFFRSYDVAMDNAYPDKTNPATVSDFRLDKYDVTVGRFRAFVHAGMDAGYGTQAMPPAAGAGAHPKINGSGWDANWNANLTANTAAFTAALNCNAGFPAWTNKADATETLPMICIPWYEAFAFCAWDGGFLPTEAEYNYAAAGGAEQRAYPWSQPANSTTIDSTYAVYNCPAGCTGMADIGKVGSKSPKGDGKWGQSDLAGNIWEWNLDWFADPYPMKQCNDCANLAVVPHRVVRGGSYFHIEASGLRTGFRSGGGTPWFRAGDVGVRCARSAQ